MAFQQPSEFKLNQPNTVGEIMPLRPASRANPSHNAADLRSRSASFDEDLRDGNGL
jgi:hypothetical protein